MQELKLEEALRKSINTYVNDLKQLYAGELIAVLLYGSSAVGEYSKGHSNINLLVVLKNTDLPTLERSRKLVNKFSNRRIEPLFFSQEHVSGFCHVFPIEFLDMKENHHCLYGTDVLKDIQVDLKNLRFQCEHELKSKLILMKQNYLRINPGNREDLKRFLFKNFNSVNHVLRNVLRLKGKEPSNDKGTVLKEIGREFLIECTVLIKICEAREEPHKLKDYDLKVLLAEFVLELDELVQKLDYS